MCAKVIIGISADDFVKLPAISNLFYIDIYLLLGEKIFLPSFKPRLNFLSSLLAVRVIFMLHMKKLDIIGCKMKRQ